MLLSVEHCNQTWSGYIFPTPPTFTKIGKESQTQGHVYIISTNGSKDVVWVCQTMPVIVKAIETIAGKRVHASSFYRLLRGLGVCPHHKGMVVTKCERDNLTLINELCQKGTQTIVFTHSPLLWRFRT